MKKEDNQEEYVSLNPADKMETIQTKINNATTMEEVRDLESEMYGIESDMLGKCEPDGWRR